jgi:hypothetical protein
MATVNKWLTKPLLSLVTDLPAKKQSIDFCPSNDNGKSGAAGSAAQHIDEINALIYCTNMDVIRASESWFKLHHTNKRA